MNPHGWAALAAAATALGALGLAGCVVFGTVLTVRAVEYLTGQHR